MPGLDMAVGTGTEPCSNSRVTSLEKHGSGRPEKSSEKCPDGKRGHGSGGSRQPGWEEGPLARVIRSAVSCHPEGARQVPAQGAGWKCQGHAWQSATAPEAAPTRQLLGHPAVPSSKLRSLQNLPTVHGARLRPVPAPRALPDGCQLLPAPPVSPCQGIGPLLKSGRSRP